MIFIIVSGDVDSTARRFDGAHSQDLLQPNVESELNSYG